MASLPNVPTAHDNPAQPQSGGRGAALLFGAIGVVFGDLGTSPLYALRESFSGAHPLAVDRPHVLGVVSLVFWALIIVVTLKYVILLMRADNRGEGGSLALQALISRIAADRPKLSGLITALGIFAGALFYGDSVLTPAISVLSAVEGLHVVAPAWGPYVLPLTLALLAIMFLNQRQGSIASVAGLVMTAWLVVLAILGIRSIIHAPEIFRAVSPHYALWFLAQNGVSGILALGSVVLAVTGAEALYTHMGQCGRLPIRLGWYLLAWPALILNYMGQGALLLKHPHAIANPFFMMAPTWAGIPLLLLAIAATLVASQTVITGAFSVTRQAVQLGYLPRMDIVHISKQTINRIYIPVLNWTLMIFVLAVVAGFRTSSDLAAAYGVAVTSTMLLDACLLGLVMILVWRWRTRRAAFWMSVFLALDLAFFLANLPKIPHGGWFPLVVAVGVFICLTTWKKGRALLFARLAEDALPVDIFVSTLSSRLVRVAGTAIFLTGTREGVPIGLLLNIKHNKVLHERVVFLTVLTDEQPFVPPAQRMESQMIGPGFQRLILRFGFMEDPNIPKALAQARSDELGFFYEPMSISYFLSRETIIPSPRPGMARWREQLFARMVQSATTAMDFFHLPCNRVVELGSQVEI